MRQLWSNIDSSLAPGWDRCQYMTGWKFDDDDDVDDDDDDDDDDCD